MSIDKNRLADLVEIARDLTEGTIRDFEYISVAEREDIEPDEIDLVHDMITSAKVTIEVPNV